MPFADLAEIRLHCRIDGAAAAPVLILSNSLGTDPGDTTAVATMKAMIEATPAPGYIACCAAVRDMDLPAEVSCIASPTLLIAGTQDLATPPADGAFLATSIAGARMIEPDAGHLSNIEQASAFTAALLDHCTA